MTDSKRSTLTWPEVLLRESILYKQRQQNSKTNLTVEAVKNSNVIEVTFKHKDPKIAAQAVNLLVEYFKEKHLQVFSDPTSSFTENQLAAYELKLRESENNLQAFKQKTQVFSIDEQRSLLLRQRGDIETALRTSETTIRELQGKIPC